MEAVSIENTTETGVVSNHIRAITIQCHNKRNDQSYFYIYVQNIATDNAFNLMAIMFLILLGE